MFGVVVGWWSYRIMYFLPFLGGVALFPKIVGTWKGSAPPYDVVTTHGER